MTFPSIYFVKHSLSRLDLLPNSDVDAPRPDIINDDLVRHNKVPPRPFTLHSFANQFVNFCPKIPYIRTARVLTDVTLQVYRIPGCLEIVFLCAYIIIPLHVFG